MAGSSNTYNELKSRILNGAILPGTVMVERETAEELGVSRVPVREAFQRLVYDGLLINSNGKELTTRTYNEQEILDLYVFRESLDGLATRLFTSRAEAMEIRYLKMVFAEMKGALDNYEHVYWQEKDIEFHQTIARGARNERLFRVIDSLYKECFYLMRTYRAASSADLDKKPEHLSVVLEEHRAIVKAVVEGDPRQAEEAARSSVRGATERMIRGFIGRNRRQNHPEDPLHVTDVASGRSCAPK